MTLFIERALFVVGPQSSGKSTQLRSMQVDRRLRGSDRGEFYNISNERRLYLRRTSPHESWETLKQFLRKTRGKMVTGRWCFACPLQAGASEHMPNVVGTVRGFIREFHPERVRVVFLSPTRDGEQQKGLFSGSNWSRNLQRIPGVEVACIDARWKRKNGLLLADFFDFT